MRFVIRAELWRFVFLIALSLLLGWASGHLLSALLLCMVAYIIWGFIQFARLLHWVADGRDTKPPSASGVWKELYSLLEKERLHSTKSIKKLRASAKRMSQFAQVVDEGVVVLKSDLRLDWWNSAAAKQLNLRDSDRNQPLSNLIRDPDFLSYVSQPEFDGAVELQSLNNSQGWIKLQAAHFGDGDIALVVTEITVLKNLERLRKEFVANVSHELRTPITVLRGYLETLNDGGIIDNPMVKKACLQMSDQVKRMQVLADDLIVLSRLEDQPKQVNLEKVELATLLSMIVEEATVVSEGKHELELQCAEGAFIMAKQGDLYSALSNLVLNAVRHNPEGAKIEVKALMKDGNLDIIVSDNGVGISAEAIPKLTERFYRADSSRNSKVGGSGLGLAIVKHVINRYGGELEIKSRLGEGAQFICHFPR